MFKFLFLAATALCGEQTLSIIKPDAVEQNHIGDIDAYLESSGLHIVGAKMIQLTAEEAKQFYSIHKDRPFYNDLVKFMSSGPILVQVLEGEDAVALNRKIMGSTDPAKASAGTIRADFGTDVQKNAVHGSDSLENAKKEISFFFKPQEIHPR